VQSELIDIEKKDGIERDKATLEGQAAQVSAQVRLPRYIRTMKD
jgi:hypothetical protein